MTLEIAFDDKMIWQGRQRRGKRVFNRNFVLLTLLKAIFGLIIFCYRLIP